MQIFINECSLQNQYYTDGEFQEAMKVLFSTFNFLNKQKLDKRVFKSNDLFVNYKAVKDKLFSSSLNHSIRDRSLKQAVILILFDKQNAVDWNGEQRHLDEDSFEYINESVTGTSMAELAERKLIDNRLIATLFNLQKSKFENLESVMIVKNKENEVHLDCVENQQALEKWLQKNGMLSYEYDYSSTEPPTDSQTVLRDTRRFQATALSPIQGRKVYLEIETKYYWYVDNLHHGQGAHLEVYNKIGDHLGKADLAGNTIPLTADKTKKIRI